MPHNKWNFCSVKSFCFLFKFFNITWAYRRSNLNCCAPRFANSSARSLPKIPLCAVTYCHLIVICRLLSIASSNSWKSITFKTTFPSAFFQPRDFHPFIHFVTELITKCESVLIHNFVIPCWAALQMAFVAAWISPQLLVGRPETGSDVFLWGKKRFSSVFLFENDHLQCVTFAEINAKTSDCRWLSVIFTSAVRVNMNKTIFVFHKIILSVPWHSDNIRSEFICQIVVDLGSFTLRAIDLSTRWSLRAQRTQSK